MARLSFLSRDTRRYPVDCDNDRASAGWTNWVQVHSDAIVLDPPSPAKRACAQAKPSPDLFPGVSQNVDEDDGMPRVGNRPDDALEASEVLDIEMFAC